jgi:hypothetical protein
VEKVRFSFQLAFLQQPVDKRNRRKANPCWRKGGKRVEQGCQIFFVQYTKLPLNYQIAINNSKWPYCIPNGRYEFQMAIKYFNIFLFQGHPKFTQIYIFGLRVYVPSGSPAKTHVRTA